MDEKFLELVLNMWDNAADSSVEQAAGDPGPCLLQPTVLAYSSTHCQVWIGPGLDCRPE